MATVSGTSRGGVLLSGGLAQAQRHGARWLQSLAGKPGPCTLILSGQCQGLGQAPLVQ